MCVLNRWLYPIGRWWVVVLQSVGRWAVKLRDPASLEGLHAPLLEQGADVHGGTLVLFQGLLNLWLDVFLQTADHERESQSQEYEGDPGRGKRMFYCVYPAGSLISL